MSKDFYLDPDLVRVRLLTDNNTVPEWEQEYEWKNRDKEYTILTKRLLKERVVPIVGSNHAWWVFIDRLHNMKRLFLNTRTGECVS